MTSPQTPAETALQMLAEVLGALIGAAIGIIGAAIIIAPFALLFAEGWEASSKW